MNRWRVLVLVTVALVALALTAGWWLPPLLSFVGANSDVIQGLTDLVQLVLWAGAGVAALLGLWQGRRKARSERPGVQYRANVEGPGAVAQGGSANMLPLRRAPNDLCHQAGVVSDDHAFHLARRVAQVGADRLGLKYPPRTEYSEAKTLRTKVKSKRMATRRTTPPRSRPCRSRERERGRYS